MSYQQDPLYNTANPSVEVVNGEFCYPKPFTPTVRHGEDTDNPSIITQYFNPGPLTFGYDNVSLNDNGLNYTSIILNWPQADWGINNGDVINLNGSKYGISYNHRQANNFVYNDTFGSNFNQVAIDSKGYFIGAGRSAYINRPILNKYNLNDPKATNNSLVYTDSGFDKNVWSLWGDNFYEFTAVAVDSNDNIYVTANDDNGTISLVKVSSIGEVLWQKPFLCATVKQNILFKDERVFVVTNIFEAGVYTAVIEFDPTNGDILESKKINIEGEITAYAYPSAVIDNNEIVVAFSYYDNVSGDDTSYIVKISLEDFSIVISRKIDLTIIEVGAINVNPNGGYVFVDQNNDVLYGFDAYLNLMFANTLYDDNTGGPMPMRNCVIGYDENFGIDVICVISDNYNIDFNASPIYVVKYDLNGNPYYTYAFVDNNNDIFLNSLTNIVYNKGQLYFSNPSNTYFYNLNLTQGNLNIESVFEYLIENFNTYTIVVTPDVLPVVLDIFPIGLFGGVAFNDQGLNFSGYLRYGISNPSYIYFDTFINVSSQPIANQTFYFEKFNQKVYVTNGINASLYVAPGDYIYADCYWINYYEEINYPYVFALKVVKVTSTKEDNNPGYFNNIIEVEGGFPAYTQMWENIVRFSIVRGKVTGVSLKCTGVIGSAHVGNIEVVSGDVLTFANPAGLTPICGNGQFTVLLQS